MRVSLCLALCLGWSAAAQSHASNHTSIEQDFPPCSAPSFDPDGDGWGWENQQSCQTTPLFDGNARKPWKVWIDPASSLMNAARSTRPQNSPDAKSLYYIAEQGAAGWYGDWSGDIYQAASQQIRSAQAQKAAAIMVVYNIPHRDCGGYSGGGAGDGTSYRAWIDRFASALGSAEAILLLEPDALGHESCLTQERYDLLRYAVRAFKARPNTAVYIDAGHSGWVSAPSMADRLSKSGVELADGFVLNVSNYRWNRELVRYGQEIRRVGVQKNFVLDTSRNGNGPVEGSDGWCNPAGRALGFKPGKYPGVEGLEGLLWVKVPGESDGSCNGGPPAGIFWRDRALELARNAGI